MPLFPSAPRRVRTPKPVSFACEALETRQLLSVALNSAGWTVITPTAADRVVYCSSSSGNDKNSGLSPSSPVQTLSKAESLLRNGSGDEMLLKAGDTWHGNFVYWGLSGQSAQNPMVLGSYGTGARPVIASGTAFGFETGRSSAPVVSYLAIMGIKFWADGRDPSVTPHPVKSLPTGIDILTKGTDILVENCLVQDYGINMNFEDNLGPLSNVTVRRCINIDAYSTTTAHSEGLYAFGVNGLTLDGNVFDANGYNNAVAGATATYFNQDCYLSANNTGVVITNNIFSRAAGTGLQDRPGGIVQNNIFINDPVAMMYGLVNGASTTVGGVTGNVTGNVFIGGANIGSMKQGQALEIGNIKPGGTTIANNVFTQGLSTAAAAIILTHGSGQSNPQGSVGINDLTLKNNVIYDWTTGIDVEAGTPGGTGLAAFNHVSFVGNEFENLTGPSVEHRAAIYTSEESYSGNSYYNAGQWTYSGGYKMAGVGTTRTSPFPFPNPTASVASYDKTISGAGTIVDFLNHARSQTQASWNTAYTAAAVDSYIAKGFGLAGGTSPTPTPTTPTPTPTTPTPTPTTPTPTPTTPTPTPTTPTPTPTATANSISGTVFSDINGNGALNSGEIGIAGFTVKLYETVSGKSTLKATTTTNAAGVYTFSKLTAGTYYLYVTNQTGKYKPTGKSTTYYQAALKSGGIITAENFGELSLTATPTPAPTTPTSTQSPSPTPTATTARNATAAFSAAKFDVGHGVSTTGGVLGSADNGDYVEFKQINFGTGVKSFTAAIAAMTGYGGTLQLRLDSPTGPTGKLVGSLKVATTGSWTSYKSETAAITGEAGIHDLYLVFVGGFGVANINTFSFA